MRGWFLGASAVAAVVVGGCAAEPVAPGDWCEGEGEQVGSDGVVSRILRRVVDGRTGLEAYELVAPLEGLRAEEQRLLDAAGLEIEYRADDDGDGTWDREIYTERWPDGREKELQAWNSGELDVVRTWTWRADGQVDTILDETNWGDSLTIHVYDTDARLVGVVIEASPTDGEAPSTSTRTYHGPAPALDHHYTHDTNTDGVLEAEGDLYHDEAGRVVHAVYAYPGFGGTSGESWFAFDDAGNRIWLRSENSSTGTSETTYTFDDGDRPLTTERRDDLDGDGEVEALAWAETWAWTCL